MGAFQGTRRVWTAWFQCILSQWTDVNNIGFYLYRPFFILSISGYLSGRVIEFNQMHFMFETYRLRWKTTLSKHFKGTIVSSLFTQGLIIYFTPAGSKIIIAGLCNQHLRLRESTNPVSKCARILQSPSTNFIVLHLLSLQLRFALALAIVF